MKWDANTSPCKYLKYIFVKIQKDETLTQSEIMGFAFMLGQVQIYEKNYNEQP